MKSKIFNRFNIFGAIMLILSLVLIGAQTTTTRAEAYFQVTNEVEFFQETKHTLSGIMLAGWKKLGGFDVLGFPVSEELVEEGRTVQYFERGILEHHSENRGSKYEVLARRMVANLIEGKSPTTNRLLESAFLRLSFDPREFKPQQVQAGQKLNIPMNMKVSGDVRIERADGVVSNIYTKGLFDWKTVETVTIQFPFGGYVQKVNTQAKLPERELSQVSLATQFDIPTANGDEKNAPAIRVQKGWHVSGDAQDCSDGSRKKLYNGDGSALVIRVNADKNLCFPWGGGVASWSSEITIKELRDSGRNVRVIDLN